MKNPADPEHNGQGCPLPRDVSWENMDCSLEQSSVDVNVDVPGLSMFLYE